MSKTKGNVMDPLEVIEKYGTDALRFALAYGVLALCTAHGLPFPHEAPRMPGDGTVVWCGPESTDARVYAEPLDVWHTIVAEFRDLVAG